MNKGHLPSDQIITISLASLPKVVALSEKVDDDDDDDAKEKPTKHQKKRVNAGKVVEPCAKVAADALVHTTDFAAHPPQRQQQSQNQNKQRSPKPKRTKHTSTTTTQEASAHD